MFTNHRFRSPIFLAPEATPSGAPPAASIFDGITVNKEGLSATVTGEELKPKVEEKPPVAPLEEKPPVPPAAPKAGQIPLEAREKGPSHARFAEVTTARDKALKELEAERAAWQAKQADYETKLSKGQVPEEVQRQLAETLAAKTKLETDLRGLIVERAARSELEPRKTAALEGIALIAAVTGDQAVVAAAKAGDYATLAEFADNGNLTALQKRDVNRLLDEARGTDQQLSERTKDPEAAWKALEERNRTQMEEGRKAQLANNMDLAKSTHTSLLQTVTALADAPDLAKEVKVRLDALAGGGPGSEKYTARHMMQVVAEHTIFETLCKNQQAKIIKLEADLKEKTEALDRKKTPNFNNSYVEQELEEETVGTGLFAPGGGITVNTGR